MAFEKLLLIRHAESAKNLVESFDGNPSLDHLTQNGEKSITQISSKLRRLSETMSIKIYCANSGRAKETAQLLIGSDFRAIEMLDAFGSMKSGPFSGMNDVELSNRYPIFFRDLQLFRAGILSGYSLRAPDGAEKWKDFEQRVNQAVIKIDPDTADLKIIVCHRSAMIALLANFARKLLNYPSSYLFFARVPPLFSALIRPDSKDNAFLIGDCSELLELLADRPT